MSDVLDPKTFEIGDIDLIPAERYILEEVEAFPRDIRSLRDQLISSLFNVTAHLHVRVRALIHLASRLETGVFVKERIPERVWDLELRQLQRIEDLDEDLHGFYNLVPSALDELEPCLDTVYRDYLLDWFRKDNPIYRLSVTASIIALWAECHSDVQPKTFDVQSIFCNGMWPPLFEEAWEGEFTCNEIMDHLNDFVEEHGTPLPDLDYYPTLQKHLDGIVEAVDEKGDPLSCEKKLALVTLYAAQDCATIDPEAIDWAVESIQIKWSGEDSFDEDLDWAKVSLDILD